MATKIDAKELADFRAYQQFKAAGGAGQSPDVRQDPAKAAAYDTWISRGKGIRVPLGNSNGGRYREEYRRGPMKGMTKDEAMTKFDSMWEAASPEVKAKYGRKATDSPTPRKISENERLNTPRKGETNADFYKRVRGETPVAKPHDKDGNGVPDMVQRPAERAVDKTVASRDLSAEARGTPEQQAIVAKMLKEGSDLGTATVGNYMDMRAAVGFPQNEDKDLIGVMKEVSARDEKVNAEKAAAAKETERLRVVAKQEAARRANGLPASEVEPPSPSPVSAPAAPQAAAPQAAAPQPAVQAPIEAPTGAALMQNPAKDFAPAVRDANGTKHRVNTLTGLPMSYMPGDALPSGANPQMQGRAEASVQRQATAKTPVARPQDVAAGADALDALGVPQVRTPVQPVTPGQGVQKPANMRSALDNGAFSDKAYADAASQRAAGIEAERQRVIRTAAQGERDVAMGVWSRENQNKYLVDNNVQTDVSGAQKAKVIAPPVPRPMGTTVSNPVGRPAPNRLRLGMAGRM